MKKNQCSLMLHSVVVLSLMVMGCSTNSIDEMENARQSINSGAKEEAATGIPSDIFLFCPGNKNAPRSEFSSYTKWYTESGGQTQVFKLHNGDVIYSDSRPPHSRSEVGQGLKFKEGSTWHNFEARFKISKKLNESLSIAQLFAGSKGPQLMVHVRKNGNIDFGSRSNGNGVIADGDWANGSRTFKIKIRTNGRKWELYFNGSLKESGITEESQKGNTDELYHFRWGIYYNYEMYTDVSATVTEIVRN
jgi:hypothetical protein